MNDDVWNAFQHRPLKGGKGKFVFKQLKNKIPGGAFDEDKLTGPAVGGLIALDLKHKIEAILAS